MSLFVVEHCNMKACLNWRMNNKCVKDGTYIDFQIKYISDIHDSVNCEIRKQLNKYRLEQMLEK